ncbi:Gfo/Idh/MocA family protein [Pseudanabaena sp. BC1403]|uniref:Gfo/Idh/MocA family protein n=1 Tax=Pseudanabaena sp. BC1403 TaxID=2043171 RepID=UPI000CD91BED|nr:Gfo/Idh/MocA family oxidoreductase [Pseudanabaena sp. BC1403]
MNLIPLNVLIVGCGNIAGRFDMNRPSADLPFTHAGAYTRDRRYQITACVEPNDSARKEFMEFWSIPVGFRTIDEVLNCSHQFDVISICSPTTCHAHDLDISISLKPKLIFCEKPVTTSALETERLVLECQKINIQLAINYTRRWDQDVSQLQTDIKNGRLGHLRSVIGVYNKGLLNNGSHLLDLLNFLLGTIHIVKVGKPVQDFFELDPTVPMWLETKDGCPVHIVAANAQDYAIFELQFIFSTGVLVMEDGGMFWRSRQVTDSDTFKGYQVLADSVRSHGNYPHAMSQAVDNIYRAIAQGDSLASTGESALLTQYMCEQIKQAIPIQ